MAGPILLVTAAVGAVLAATVLLWLVTGVPPMRLLGEPALLDGGWYAGALGELTVLLWAASGVALLLLGAADHTWAPPARALGAFTLLLMVDDRFAVHENALRVQLGVPERLTMAVYLLIAVAIAYRHGRSLLRHPDVAILLVAIGALACSLAIDLVPLQEVNGFQAIEESFKLLGAGLWTLFAVRATLRVIPRRSRPSA